jgi:hypothetical protein
MVFCKNRCIIMLNDLQTPPPPPPKGKVKASQVIPLIILVVSIVGALYFSGFFDGTFPSAPSTLTPTRDIVGTWKTTFQTTFNIATDFQNFGQLEDVGSEERIMTWTITATDKENIVMVNVEFSYSNRQLIAGSGYTPDVSTMQLTGIINATQLTLTKGDSGPIKQVGSVGVFTFTSTQMEGTWHDHWTGVYEQNVYTSTNGLKLSKQ